MAVNRQLLRTTIFLLFAFLFPCICLGVEASRFDLIGPKVEVRITRSGKMLPVAAVPNLQPGDQLWLHADLPASQSVHYLLVVVFLRGTTNPPPDKWFTRIETWNKRTQAEGVTVTVPQEAQQALLFLAPETGGDYATLRSAVRGRPGIFVRASQDLTEAGFEQARIEKYLQSMREVPPSDPKALMEHSQLLSRTLNLRPKAECFTRPVDQQYTCLTQTGTQSLLDDGHGQTIVSSLTSGAGSDFIAAASATSLAGGGTYSAYVGAVVDLVRLTSGLHTAHYQYIPAIAFPEGQSLNLRLNTPPSFLNPKSVIVIGLPSVQAAVAPPLRPADPDHVSCLLKPGVVLPVEGAPLVFSTGFAHDLVLRLKEPKGAVEIPVAADAFRGGLVLAPAEERRNLTAMEETRKLNDGEAPDAAASKVEAASPATLKGAVSGQWGFDPFAGPVVKLQDAPGTGWRFPADSPQIIAGEPNHLTLTAEGTACLAAISMEGPDGHDVPVSWKAGAKPNLVDITVTPHSSDPGRLRLLISQYGSAKPTTIEVQTFSKAAELTSLELHANDSRATLRGSNLGEVRQVGVGGVTFTPLSVSDGSPVSVLGLAMAPGGDPKALKAGHALTAEVLLKDGRTLPLGFEVGAVRPVLELLGKGFEMTSPSVLTLTSKEDIPLSSRLTISLRAGSKFPRDGQIELETVDGALDAKLTLANGSLVLQDRRTVLAHVDLLKEFGSSAFGPLQLRLVEASGIASDWMPVGTLVRLPTFQELHCPTDPTALCTLSGSQLFLVTAISADAAFTAPVEVPEGFVDGSISIPRPSGVSFYVKLRDDPTVVDSATLPILTP